MIPTERVEDKNWVEVGYFNTALNVDIYFRKPQSEDDYTKQIQFLQQQDALAKRLSFLWNDEELLDHQEGKKPQENSSSESGSDTEAQTAAQDAATNASSSKTGSLRSKLSSSGSRSRSGSSDSEERKSQNAEARERSESNSAYKN